MKKKNHLLICCFTVLIIFLSSCTHKTPVVETIPDDIKLLVEEAAKQVVADLANGDYANVTALFDKEMLKALPEDRLKEAWESTAAGAGEYYEIMSAESSMSDGYYICLVTARHEIKGIVLRVVYDKDMQISGLFFSYTENPTELAEKETSITIGAEYPLDGVLAMPSGTQKVPAVVLVHGSGPSDKDESAYGIKVFKDISDYLAANGVAVLRYDKRTYTYAASLPPDITVNDETIEDAILAGQLLSLNERIDGTKIFVIGHSMGGMLAPRIVEESNGVFSGAVIMAGSPRSLLDIIYDQNMYFVSLALESERDALIEQVEGAMPYFGLPQGYIDEMDAHPVSDYINSTDKPYLILQGGKDFQVSAKKDFEAYKQLAGGRSNFEFRLYDNLTHFFTISTMEHPTPDDYVAGAHVDNTPLSDILQWVKER